jgi:hypothetical protein
MRGKKTTALEKVQEIDCLLKKHGITDTSFGIIIPVRNRRDHRVTVKYIHEGSCHLLSITTKLYKQEYRIYDQVPKNTLMGILENNLGEQFRIL